MKFSKYKKHERDKNVTKESKKMKKNIYGKLSKASLLMVHNPYLKKQYHNKAWGRTQRFEIKVRSIVEMSK